MSVKGVGVVGSGRPRAAAFLLLVGTGLGALVLGCGPTRTAIRDVHTEAQRPPVLKMVVVVANMAKDEGSAVEDVLVADLQRRGVEARALHVLFPIEPTEADDTRSTILAQGYEAVLRVELAKIDTQTVSVAGDDFEWRNVNINASLFEASNDDLVWSAATRTPDPIDERDLARSVSAVLLPALAKAGLILPLRHVPEAKGR